MSALGQKRTFAVQKGPPQADMCGVVAHVHQGRIEDTAPQKDLSIRSGPKTNTY